MDREAYEHHALAPQGRDHAPPRARTGSAGGAACGDLVTVRVATDRQRIVDAGFSAAGCGALTAAGSAAVALVRGAGLLDAARVGTDAIATELGGLSPGKLHAADLVADALHAALGAAAAADGALPASPARTLVAMSGGVDSAVAALLVARSGREVAAVTLELWRDPDNDAEASCCSASAVRLARSVAHRMGLPHFTLDLRAEFRAGVVEPWLAEHRSGLTPNPCVRCNGHVRLDAMLAFADRLGAADLATGHYARTSADGLLRAAADPAKDQAYMLAALAPESLARLRFPLGDLTKPAVRALAAEAGLPVADRRESQDLCFLAGTGKAAFLAKHGALGDRPGPIVDTAGRRLGEHRGTHHLTVGQRRGLALGGTAEPVYVLRTDGDRVVVGPRAALATTEVPVRGARLHRDPAEVDRVKLRYRSQPLPCRVRTGSGDRLVLELEEPATGGAAPGQTACLMRGDVVVGWATIA